MTYPYAHNGNQVQPKRRFALLWEYPNSAIVRHYGAATKAEMCELHQFATANDRKLYILRMNKFGTGLLQKPFSDTVVLSGHVLFISLLSGRSPVVRICVGTDPNSTNFDIVYLNVNCTPGDIFDDSKPFGVLTCDRQPLSIDVAAGLDTMNIHMSYTLRTFHAEPSLEDAHIVMPTLYMFGSVLSMPTVSPSRYASFPPCLGIGASIDPDIIPFMKDRANTGNYHYRRLPIATGGTVGLTNNNGIMCYVNSVTQCLAHTALFKNFCTKGMFREGINKTSPLGTKGQLAQAFGALINRLWDPQYGTVPSTAMWKAIGSFKCFFEEYQQQDAQEFLACLLDGLHEDYNEVNERILVPKFEPSDQLPIEEVADECWKRYLLRNRSFLVGNCMGMLKSTLQCKTCGKGNLTFDPYMQLTLELPDSEPEQLVEWTYFPPDYPSALPVQFQRIVPPFATAGDLKEITIRELTLTDITPTDMFWCVLTYRNDESGTKAVTVNPFYSVSGDRDSQKVFHINMEVASGGVSKRVSQRHLTIGIFASKPSPPSVFRMPVVINCHENVKNEGTLHPIIILLSQSEMMTSSLITEIRRRTGISEDNYRIAGAQWDECCRDGCSFCHNRCSGCPIWPMPERYQQDPSMQYGMGSGNSFGSDTSNIERESQRLQETVLEFLRNNNMEVEWELSLAEQEDPDCVATVVEALSEYSGYLEAIELENMTIPQIIDHAVTERFSSFGRDPSNYFDQPQTLKVEYDSFCETVPTLATPIVVKVCWETLRLTPKLDLNMLIPKSHDLILKNPQNEIHVKRQQELDKRVYTLAECLELFTRVEKLGQGDMWKCTNCRREEPSRKRFEIWSLPNLLFIHIKRFAARGDCSLRLRHHVSFPMKGLDLSEYMAKRGQSTKSGCNLASPTLEARSNGTPPALSIGRSSEFPALIPTGTPTKAQAVSETQLPKYKLTGVVTHHGPDIQYGHYTTHCLHENGKWYHFDDDTVTEKTEDDVLNNLQKDVYLLCYSRDDFTPDSWIYKTAWPDTSDVLERVKEENRVEREKEKKEKEDREARKRIEKEEAAAQPEVKRQRPSSEIHPRQPQAELPIHVDPQVPLMDSSQGSFLSQNSTGHLPAE
eukprot:TRINITY_DN2114_c3_g1_i2.p1 TRINITY_DN2114_c3_g1~~TRINITY_DN2114_c3_g1_i2.p1  ORF type:complete len:1116 (+),score=161.42 TRINITY_DN2114_c3_g1_i2:104-3451(+)